MTSMFSVKTIRVESIGQFLNSNRVVKNTTPNNIDPRSFAFETAAMSLKNSLLANIYAYTEGPITGITQVIAE